MSDILNSYLKGPSPSKKVGSVFKMNQYDGTFPSNASTMEVRSKSYCDSPNRPKPLEACRYVRKSIDYRKMNLQL